MKRFHSMDLPVLVALALAGCGGGDAGSADTAADTMAAASEMEGQAETMAGELTMPSWMTVDESAQTVSIDLVAGQTDANNRWNYNGYANGNATVVVPQGYTVTMNLTNDDPVNPHSVVVMASMGSFPVQFDAPTPVFDGAMSENPTDMATSTLPGESETITFVADQAGEYALVCTIPAHAATGMWIGFTVSATGDVGLEG